MDEEFIPPNRTAVPGEGRAAREVFWYPAGHLFPVSRRTCLKEVLSEMCLRGRRAEGSRGAARGGHPLLRLQPKRSAGPGGAGAARSGGRRDLAGGVPAPTEPGLRRRPPLPRPARGSARGRGRGRGSPPAAARGRGGGRRARGARGVRGRGVRSSR